MRVDKGWVSHYKAIPIRLGPWAWYERYKMLTLNALTFRYLPWQAGPKIVYGEACQ